jgi:hypothetical protein
LPSGKGPKEKRKMLFYGGMKYITYNYCTNHAKPFQIEYLVVAFDEEEKKVVLSLRQADILAALAKDEELTKKGGCVPALQSITR